MTYGKHMNSLENICTQVWGVGDVESKQALLKQAVSMFKYKQKVDYFNNLINRCNNATELDRIASNLILNKSDKVVGLIPR